MVYMLLSSQGCEAAGELGAHLGALLKDGIQVLADNPGRQRLALATEALAYGLDVCEHAC